LKNKPISIKAVAILITGVAIAFLFSCKKKTTQTTSTPAQPLPAVASFSVNIIPIFNASCNAGGCHGTSSPAAGLDLTTASAYSSLFAKNEIYTANPSGSNLYLEISNGEMPQAKAALSSYQTQLVLEWIQQGAKNN
jgi:hypothetical protein